MSDEPTKLTVGRLIEDLQKCNPDNEIAACVFGGNLTISFTNLVTLTLEENQQHITLLVLDKFGVVKAIQDEINTEMAAN